MASPIAKSNQTRKVAVVLSGCGNQDGAEITEAVSLIVALSQYGASVKFFAPSVEFTAKDHRLRREIVGDKRNSLIEAARIARGEVEDLKDLNQDHFDALAFVGGYGAATRLSNWSELGPKCKVLPEVEKAILGFYEQSKPIAAVCIAPTLIARVLGSHNVTVTIGNDPSTIKQIEATGAHHEVCPVDDFVTDRDHKVITTPAYMYDAKPHEIFKGISALAKELCEMA